MGVLSLAGDRAGLSAAAKVIARQAKRIVRARPNSTRPYIGSKKIPPTIESYITAGFSEARKTAYVSAGGAGGLEAPNAYMFETKGARHPLFGDMRHWYEQPFFGFLEQAAEEASQAACEKYADIAIPIWARESGYR